MPIRNPLQVLPSKVSSSSSRPSCALSDYFNKNTLPLPPFSLCAVGIESVSSGNAEMNKTV